MQTAAAKQLQNTNELRIKYNFDTEISVEDIRALFKHLENAEMVEVVEEIKIEAAKSQLDLLHKNDDGYITIAAKHKDNWIQRHYKKDQLDHNIHKFLSVPANLYISPNSFYKPTRTIESIKKLNSLYIDLDYYNIPAFKGLKFEQILWLLEEDYFGKEVPYPNFVMDTGRGGAIFWLINPVRDGKLALWNVLQNNFLEKLRDIGADPKSIDAARVMRMAGSINQKSGRAASIIKIYSEEEYNIKDLQAEYLPALTPYINNLFHKKKGRKAKIVNLYTLYSLHDARLKDLVKLMELRQGYCRLENGKLIEKGQREFICFLYRYWSCCYEANKNKALESTLEFNKGFILPLSEKEITRATSSAEKAFEEWLKDSPTGIYKRGGYNYKNEKLIKLLNITEEEMKHLKTIINKNEIERRNKEYKKARRRNEEGLTLRQQQKMEKIKAVEELRLKGLSIRKISKELNISIGAVSEIINGKY